MSTNNSDTNISLRTDQDAVHACTIPFEGCDYALAQGVCPVCEHTDEGTFRVRGRPGSMHHTRDQYRAAALCVKCGTALGQLIVEVNTIFGIEEDERVLKHGRARVYS